MACQGVGYQLQTKYRCQSVYFKSFNLNFHPLCSYLCACVCLSLSFYGIDFPVL